MNTVTAQHTYERKRNKVKGNEKMGKKRKKKRKERKRKRKRNKGNKG